MRRARDKFVLWVLWASFVALWYRVYTISTFPDVAKALTYLTGITSIYGVLVALWVFHNIAIYKRKGPRTAVRFVDDTVTHDALRNYIVANADMKLARVILIEVNDGRKFFDEGILTPTGELIASA